MSFSNVSAQNITDLIDLSSSSTIDTASFTALNVPPTTTVYWVFLKKKGEYEPGGTRDLFFGRYNNTYGTFDDPYGNHFVPNPGSLYVTTVVSAPLSSSTQFNLTTAISTNPHVLNITANSIGEDPISDNFCVWAITGHNPSEYNVNATNYPWLTSIQTTPLSTDSKPLLSAWDPDFSSLSLSGYRILFNLGNQPSETFMSKATTRHCFNTHRIPIKTISIGAVSSDSMTINISSSEDNDLINWMVYDKFSTSYLYKTAEQPIGEYDGCVSSFAFSGTNNCSGTNTISLTAYSDRSPFYITVISAGSVYPVSAISAVSATSGLNFFTEYDSTVFDKTYIGHYAEVVEFLPKYPTFSVISYGDNVITLSAHFTNDNNDISTIPAALTSNISWNIDTITNLSAGHGFIANQITGVNTITLGCTSDSTTNYILTTDINDSFNRTPYIDNITFNDILNIDDSLSNANILNATAKYASMSIPVSTVNPTKQLSWTATPTGFINVNGAASTVGTINLTATLTSQLTSSYVYTLCSGDLSAIDVFTPYLDFTVSSTLTGVEISKTIDERETTFNVRVLGKTASHLYNISPNYTLSYSNPYTNMILTPLANNYVEIVINNPLYSGSYIPVIYSIPVSALPLTTGLSSTGTIQVTSYPYVSESSFYPVLQIDSNDPVSHLYMITATDIDLKVDPSTILIPSGATGNYLFTLNGSPQGGTFSSTANLKSKIANYATTGMSAATAVLSVSANYGSDVIVRSYQTTITFVSANNITTSDIKVYPEYKWDINNWKKVINTSTYELSSTSPAFIYGNGRTETFVLSTRDNTDIGRYDWAINRGSGYNYIGSSRILNTNIKTLSANNETIGVRVTGYTEIGDIPLPAVTITNAISVSLIPIPTLSADIAMPIEVGAPDSLIITSSKSVMSGTTAIPINIRLTTAIYNISCSYWTTSSIALGLGSQDLSYISIPLNVSDIGTPVLSIPKFESTNLIVSILPTLIYEYLNHPTWNDWETSLPQPTTGNITSGINAFPINPYYYTPNKYLELNGNSSIEVTMTNIVPFNNLISGFDWESGTTVSSISNFDPFKGIYNEENVYNVVMTSKLVSATPIVTTNLDALYIVDNYPVYDPEINRQVKVPIGPLPYPCGIGSNEWLTCENINLSFKKIYDNLMYLYKQTKIYDEPPTEYIGWLGSILMADDTTRLRWHINSTGLDYGYTTPQISVDKELNNLQDCIVKDNVVFVSNASSVSIISPEFTPSIINTQTRRDIIDDFNFIKTIQVDNDDKRIYVLDTKDVNNHYSGSKNKLSIFIYNNDPVDNGWELLYSWGGFGAATSTLKFNNPQDMFLDGNNILWVADTDNLVIKKYYRNGNWIKTISSSKFTTSNKPVSLCVDSSNNLQVLCNNKVVVFDYNGNYKYEYDVPNTVPYIKIRPSADDDLIYITSNNNTIKCNINGTIQLPLNNYSMSLSYVLDNRSVYQDEYRNLYICQKNHILKYNDTIKYISLVEDSLLDNLWTLDEIYIKNQEYIQDWVVNKALNRLWDNIEIFRRSILGKLSYERIVREEPFGESWETLVPRDRSVCNIDWWPSFMHSRDYMTRYCYVIPRIRTFLPFERLSLPYAKDDVFVGINELVTADVLNRTLCQLQQNLLVIKELLKQPDDKSDELCDGIDEPIDVVLDDNALSLSACYPELFQINPCFYAVNINGILNPCTGVETNYTLDLISTATCSAGIQQYNWYVDNILLSAINPADDDQTFRYTFNSTDPVTISMELSANNIVYTKKNVIVTPKSC